MSITHYSNSNDNEDRFHCKTSIFVFSNVVWRKIHIKYLNTDVLQMVGIPINVVKSRQKNGFFLHFIKSRCLIYYSGSDYISILSTSSSILCLKIQSDLLLLPALDWREIWTLSPTMGENTNTQFSGKYYVNNRRQVKILSQSFH